MLGNCRLLTFFKIDFFQKILSGTLSECQTVWTHIRIDILSVLIWVQTVCKGYQQMTKLPLAGKELRYISHIMYLNNFPAVGCKTPMMNNKKCFPMHSKICPTDPKEPGTITNVLTRNLWCSLLILHPTYCNFAKIIVFYFQLSYRNSDLLVIK